MLIYPFQLAGAGIAAGKLPPGFRFWRLNCTANNGSTNLAIGDFELRSSIGGASIFTGGTPSASSTNGSYVAANAFDNNAGTLWNAATSSGWLMYVLPANLELVNAVQFAVRTRSDGYTADAPKDFTLEYSSGGVSWTVLKTITAQTGWAAGELRAFTI